MPNYSTLTHIKSKQKLADDNKDGSKPNFIFWLYSRHQKDPFQSYGKFVPQESNRNLESPLVGQAKFKEPMLRMLEYHRLIRLSVDTSSHKYC